MVINGSRLGGSRGVGGGRGGGGGVAEEADSLMG